jgi:uncharacterized membrane protein
MLRMTLLGSKSVWLDESFSVWQANQTPTEIWNATYDNHPPMYYLLLKAWMNIGDSEAIIRFPSIVVSMMGLVLLYVLAARLFDEKIALMAVAFLALSPLDLWYAQEARMVIFVMPAALLIGLGLLEMGWRGGLLIGAGLALGLYFDYTIIPLWIILSSIWFVRWWGTSRPRSELIIWACASLGAWLLFFPLWSHLYLVAGRMSNIFIFSNIREIIGLPVIGVALPVLAISALAAGTIILVRLIPSVFEQPQVGRVLAIFAVGAFILLTALTPIPRLYSIKRIIVTGWPFVVIGIAWLAVYKIDKQRVVLWGVLSISFISSLIILLAVPKDDWRGALALINDRARSGDVVWLDPRSGSFPYEYYHPVLDPQFTNTLKETPPQTEVWHVAERQPNRPVPGSEAESWLDANRRLLEVFPLYRLELRHYSAQE